MIVLDAIRVRDADTLALDGATMLLPANAVHGIAGRGRSALLKAVYGLLPLEAGSITEAGRPLRRRDIGYLEADPVFFSGLTARDHIDLVRRRNRTADPAPWLRRLPVPLDREAARLAPAERKHLALILTMMQPKRILLLDHPFRGLGPEGVFALQRWLLQLGTKGRTVVIAESSIARLEGICDDLYALAGGQVRGRYEHYEWVRALRETAADAEIPEK